MREKRQAISIFDFCKNPCSFEQYDLNLRNKSRKRRKMLQTLFHVLLRNILVRYCMYMNITYRNRLRCSKFGMPGGFVRAKLALYRYR